MSMSRAVLSILVFALLVPAARAEDPKADPWRQVRFLVGEWNGTASGEPGSGTVARRYEFILEENFIQESNTSTYPPQDKNKSGEVHHHLGFISYDRQRNTLVIRQFHEESFVNTYALNSASSTDHKLVFESEHFENFDNTWKARETYDIVSEDEFIETFELAPPGKPFEVYSRSHFKRVK